MQLQSPYRGLLLLFLLFHSQTQPCSSSGLGIPGTTQTTSGYDTEFGKDAICWQSLRAHDNSSNDSSFDLPNPLIEGFRIDANGVALLQSCPIGNSLRGVAPTAWLQEERLRTGQWYNYTVSGQINLTALGGSSVVADAGSFVSIQILLCVLGSSGFCHPFVHEEANERLIAEFGTSAVVERGDRHGGSHVHSPYYLLELPAGRDPPVYSFENVEIPMLINDPGNFFAVTAVQVYVPIGDDSVRRYDMANALEQRIIAYQDPAVILTVSDGILYFSYIAIAVVSSVILFLLYHTVRNRGQQVMQLTQGPFLIVFLWSALVATVCCFLMEPKNDNYCRAANPLVMVHMQLLYAITIGRLWRINSVISPLLVETLKERDGNGQALRKIRRWLCCNSDGQADSNHRGSLMSSILSFGPARPRTLRRQVTAGQLVAVVAICTAPQVILQLLSVLLQPKELTFDMNEDESKGRVSCSAGVPVGASLDFYGYLCFCCTVVLLLLIAYSTRGLPSLFNETKVIFDSTLTTLMLLVVGIGIMVATDDPTASPVIRYMVEVGVILSATFSTTVRIMMPKLRMVWNGEKVLVSKLVSDHKQSIKRGDTQSAVMNDDVGVYDPESVKNPGEHRSPTYNSNISTTKSDSQAIYDDLNDFVKKDPDVVNEIDELEQTRQSAEAADKDTDLNQSGLSSQSPTKRSRIRFRGSVYKHSEAHHRVVIDQDRTPSRRLVLKMLSLQEHLSRVNERIISGLVVDEEDWVAVRRLNVKLATSFQEDVEFAWEKEDDGHNSDNFQDEHIHAAQRGDSCEGEVEAEHRFM